MSIYREAGLLILGSRFKRLGERMIAAVGQVYREQGIPFEPGWFPLFFLLGQEEALPISTIAKTLAVTQSAVSQQVKILQAKKLVEGAPAPVDRRIRAVRLTESGRRLYVEIQPIWGALQSAAAALMNQALTRSSDPAGHGLLSQIERLEQLLDEEGLDRRIQALL